MKTLHALALSLLALPAYPADTATRHELTLAGARHVLAAAVEYAHGHDAPGAAIAVVDTGGRPICLERLDDTFPAAADISVGKARTAALFRKPTRVLEDAVVKGRTSMLALPAVTGFTPLQGGVPLERGGEIVGAIGVSGAASAQQDDEIASAAAAAFSAASATPDAVSYIDAAHVDGALREGAALLRGPGYKVDASRREVPGEAEVHEYDTDIFYVLGGSATLVTGGELVDARRSGPGELRGSSIAGGIPHSLQRGDVITIPHDVPHWFSAVDAPFTYYVVKSIAGSGD